MQFSSSTRDPANNGLCFLWCRALATACLEAQCRDLAHPCDRAAAVPFLIPRPDRPPVATGIID